MAATALRTGSFPLLLLAPLLLAGCFVPRHHWPQDDHPARTVAGRTDARVLIAARDTPSKRALVEQVIAGLAQAGPGIDVIGVGGLAEVDPAGYDAVIAISPVLAWGLDAEVEAFRVRLPDRGKLLVVVTRDGSWEPDREALGCEVLTGASTPADVAAMAAKAVAWARASVTSRP